MSETETVERLKEEAKCLGYRLSKIPEKKEPGDDVPKKKKRALYLVKSGRPEFRIEDDVDLKTLDKSDEHYVTCSEPEIRVLSKLFMSAENDDS